MRTREKIEEEQNEIIGGGYESCTFRFEGLSLEILLDIRELLQTLTTPK